MRLAIERQSGTRDRVPHPSAEAVDGEGFAVARCDNYDVLHVKGIERFDRVAMQRNEQFATGLLLLYPDPALRRDVCPRHPHDVGAALTKIEKEMKRGALFSAERPTLFELLYLVISPRSDFFDLWPFDAQRWIVLQPPDIDRVPNEDAKLLQDIECGAGAIRIGLKNAGNDALA